VQIPRCNHAIPATGVEDTSRNAMSMSVVGGQGGGVESESIDTQEMGVPVLVFAEYIGNPLGDGWPLEH